VELLPVGRTVDNALAPVPPTTLAPATTTTKPKPKKKK
jgi:hypothetical protein